MKIILWEKWKSNYCHSLGFFSFLFFYYFQHKAVLKNCLFKSSSVILLENSIMIVFLHLISNYKFIEVL